MESLVKSCKVETWTQWLPHVVNVVVCPVRGDEVHECSYVLALLHSKIGESIQINSVKGVICGSQLLERVDLVAKEV